MAVEPSSRAIGSGCAFELGRYAVVALLYVGVLRFYFPGSGTTLAALALSVFATFLLNSLQQAFVSSPDRRAVMRALAGTLPKDGARVALSGQLVPTGPLLTSPLGQVPCVAYHYWIGERVRSVDPEHGTREVKNFRGFASVPCALRTGLGDVRLRGLAATHVDTIGQRKDCGRGALERAREFIAETRFEPDPGHSITRLPELWKRIVSELANPSLATRYDFIDGDREVRPYFVLSEAVLHGGQPLTAIGRFHENGPELGHDGAQLLTLVAESLEAARDRLKDDATSAWWMALGMFVVAHAMLAAAIHGGAFD